MSGNQMFNVTFVKEIERRPCIWNCSSKEYGNRHLKEKAWMEVSKEVKQSVRNCRERWRNIRGVFLRSMKKSSSKNTKYYLNEYLGFLLPHIKMRTDSLNFRSISSDCVEGSEAIQSDSEDNPFTEEDPLQLPIDQIKQDRKERDQNSYTAKRRYTRNVSTVSNPADDAMMKWLKSRNDNEEHPNMSFLRSLLPDMTKMTDKQNRRFRQKVVGLIDDILEDADIRDSSN